MADAFSIFNWEHLFFICYLLIYEQKSIGVERYQPRSLEIKKKFFKVSRTTYSMIRGSKRSQRQMRTLTKQWRKLLLATIRKNYALLFECFNTPFLCYKINYQFLNYMKF